MLPLYLLNRIRAAVRSIAECTSPEIHYNSVYARGCRMASPYASHRGVEYGYSGVEYDALVARSSRYGLLVSDRPLRCLYERYKDMTYLWRECLPSEYPFVSKWMGGYVPRVVVEPLLAFANRLGLGVPFEDEQFLHAYVITPVLAGWHYQRPVFAFAESDDTNPALNMLKIDGEPVHRQGSLLVLEERMPTGFPEMLCYQWLYNHTKALNPSEPWKAEPSERAERSAFTVAVSYKGQTMAATGLHAPCRLWADDHDLLDLNEGEYILLHPFPSDRGVD